VLVLDLVSSGSGPASCSTRSPNNCSHSRLDAGHAWKELCLLKLFGVVPGGKKEPRNIWKGKFSTLLLINIMPNKEKAFL